MFPKESLLYTVYCLPDSRTVQFNLQQDNDVELVIVEDVSHFDSDGFVQPLSEAVPWIMNAWKQ